jgi:aerobic carbon-monoxide dehydrogenase large subunit
MTQPFKGRREDQRFITGRGQYTADFNVPGQLHAVFLRADRAHARILSIDKTPAERAEGVRLVLVGADLVDAGLQPLIPLAQFPGRGGAKIRSPQRSPITADKVRFVGEAVALVLADTAMAAQNATEAIVVDYEDLTPIVGCERALEAPALVHDNVPGNLCFDFDYGDEKKTAEAFARADRVVRVDIASPRVAPTPMEPRAVLAHWNAQEERYEIRCPHQGAFAMRDTLAQMLGVDVARVRVEFTDVGGAFGARTAPYYEFIALLHASKRAGRPVKWVSTRGEDFLNDGHGRGIQLSGELALTNEGRFLAFRTSWLADTGAYLTQAGTLTNSMNGKTMAAGPYKVDAFYGHHRQLMTNAAPTEAFRGAGRPEAAYIVERLVDQAALETGIDRIELRRRNVIPKDAFPYTGITGTVFDSADFRGMLDAAERASNWKAFESRRSEAKAKGRLLGIGCALFIEPSGGGGVPKDQVGVQFAASGRLQLYMAAGANGQGHETIFPEMIGEWLGIGASKIDLRAGDPDGPALIGGASIGSRTAMSQGSAFRAAATEVIQKGLDLAADALEVSKQDVEFRDGRYVVKGTDRGIRMTDIVERHRVKGGRFGAHPLDTMAEAPANRAFPSGMHVCEVEIDAATGESCIVAYTAVDDIGRVLNHALAEGQIHGGVVQAAGHVFGEQCVYDMETGQMLSGSFMDYPMPRADLVRGFRVEDHSMPSPNNALGAKGAGEAGTTGGMAACMSAVLDALRPAGVKHFDMPATPGRVWEALRRAAA